MGKKPEIMVREAAAQIGVSERMILKYISMKRFRAIKVGREWFIDFADFVSFAKKYDYPLKDEQEPFGAPEAGSEPVEERVSSAESKEESAAAGMSTPTDEASGKARSRRFGNVHKLRVYELLQGLFSSGHFVSGTAPVPTSDLPPSVRKEIRVAQLADLAMEELGAGFYAYETQTKRQHYVAARSRLGAILALLHSQPSLSKKWRAEIESLEERIVPAFAALIRKMEKKHDRRNDDR